MRALALPFATAILVLHAGCKNDTPPAPATPQSSVPVASTSAAPPTASSTPVSTVAPTTSSSAPRASGPSEPPPASPFCQTDGDCLLSTFPGCCSCCTCGKLHAVTKSMDFAQSHACANKNCPKCDSGPQGYACVACVDPEKEGMKARCSEKKECILVETSAPREASIACKTDDDCWMDDARKPIARPAKLRGKKIEPCKGGHEHAPACSKDGVCVVRAFKC